MCIFLKLVMLKQFKYFKKFSFIKKNTKTSIINRFDGLIAINKLYKLVDFEN